MTTRTPIVPSAVHRLGGSIRRTGALARVEALLLRRNPMALLNAVGTPLIGVALLNALPPQGDSVPMPGAGIVVTLTAFALLFPLYYNLVTTLVARREELVLKRLRSGECSDAEILIGAAAPAAAIACGQITAGAIAAAAVGGMAVPVRHVVVVAAVLLGTVVFGLLAAVSTAMTRTVDMAQLSTLPVVVLSMSLGGLFPPAMLPGPLPWVAEFLPLTQEVDLMWLGLTGTTRDGTPARGWAWADGVVAALLVLTAWIVVGVLARRRFMRWEPRN
jgi:ABC-2 type transport system permease protein